MNTETENVVTVGHSNRSEEDFLALLECQNVRRLIDVRSSPSSRRFPHFNEGNLQETLAEAGIQYEHWPELGGYRDPGEESVNTALSGGFRAVADHLNTGEGQAALDDLEERVAETEGGRVALMCAEKNFRDCHRRLISDHLLARGYSVLHLMDSSSQVHHELHRNARVQETRVTYPGLV